MSDELTEGGEDEVVLPIERHIDLHAFRPRDVASVVEAYLEAALAAGYDEVRLIHGRGIGTQREIVRSVLKRHPHVCLHLIDMLCDRLRWTSYVIESTVFLDIPRRLSKRILMLVNQYGREGPRGIELDSLLQIPHHPGRSGSVALVHHEEIGDLKKPRLHGLHGVTGLGGEDDHRGVSDLTHCQL